MVLAATRTARRLGSVEPEVPPAAAELVDRALAFQKSERWPNAAAMRDAVRETYRALYGEEASPAALVFMASPEKMPVSDRSPLRSPMASTVPATPVSIEPRRLGLGGSNPTSLVGMASQPSTLSTGRVRVALGAVVLTVAGMGLGAWGATRSRGSPPVVTSTAVTLPATWSATAAAPSSAPPVPSAPEVPPRPVAPAIAVASTAAASVTPLALTGAPRAKVVRTSPAPAASVAPSVTVDRFDHQ
jgi:serine/threonine-protein kinase